jgi:predicted SnoaL-like aldol condensation-catalyzing enzyme
MPPTPSRWKRTRRPWRNSTTSPSTRRISKPPRSSSAPATSSTTRAPPTPEGLKAFLAFLRDKFPDYHSEIKRIFADGDYVIVHVHNVPTPGSRGNAIVDIFKLENGKVVEHWDVRQEIPEQSANSNTMF